ncbi:MAG: nuclear transport factor 2 family protein [Clostridiales bacterium]|nr:nuclear transport factor 2 family protein [Clostridiales bacterium]
MCDQKQVYTDDELIGRVWDIEEIKNLTSRRVYYVANDMRQEELEDLWVQEPEHRATASFGQNWGYYVGMDRIAEFYVGNHEKRRQAKLDEICAKHSEIEKTEENIGLGCMQLNPITTPQIELAGDGQTARAMWFNTGMMTELDEDLEPVSNWVFEKMGVDYMKEGGKWKIWHLFLSLEHFSGSGVNPADTPLEPALPENPYQEEFGTPDIAFLAHNVRYNWWDNYPDEPKPYQSFSMKDSYAPEGHPAMQSDETMKLWNRGLLKW